MCQLFDADSQNESGTTGAPRKNSLFSARIHLVRFLLISACGEMTEMSGYRAQGGPMMSTQPRSWTKIAAVVLAASVFLIVGIAHAGKNQKKKIRTLSEIDVGQIMLKKQKDELSSLKNLSEVMGVDIGLMANHFELIAQTNACLPELSDVCPQPQQVNCGHCGEESYKYSCQGEGEEKEFLFWGTTCGDLIHVEAEGDASSESGVLCDGFSASDGSGVYDVISIAAVCPGAVRVKIDGLAGSDHIWSFSTSYSPGPSYTSFICGGVGDDFLTGSTGFDNLFGNGGDDVLRGRGRDDFLSGGNGNDTIYGDEDDDMIMGGNGNDCLSGMRSAGTGGADWVYGGAGNDHIRYSKYGFGGSGNDELNAYAGGGATLHGDAGSDILKAEYSASEDTLYGDSGNDYLGQSVVPALFYTTDHYYGGGGSDTFFLTFAERDDGSRELIQATADGGPGDDIFYDAFVCSSPETDAEREACEHFEFRLPCSFDF